MFLKTVNLLIRTKLIDKFNQQKPRIHICFPFVIEYFRILNIGLLLTHRFFLFNKNLVCSKCSE